VTMPPQHGKSELTTRRFPAFLLGINPKLRIAICSYSATVAEGFNRNIQQVIDDKAYKNIFPGTYLNESNVVTVAKGSYLRNSEMFETVGHRGFLKSTGVCGPLTSTTVDIGIIDDPIKDRQEAKSPTYRQRVWDWFVDVFETRLHNDSQVLIIMTRWDQDDLVGRVLLRDKDWHLVKFEGIKTGPKTDYDQREPGEVLFPEKHSLERLLAIRENNPVTFDSLYQQDPKPNKEALVYSHFKEITKMPMDYPFGYALDFGFTNDPTAFVQLAMDRKRLYGREVFYLTGLTNTQIKMHILQAGVRPTDLIVADSAEPKSIRELQETTVAEATEQTKKQFPRLSGYLFKDLSGKEYYRLPGLNVMGAAKGPDSVTGGIGLVKDLDVYLTTDSHNLWNEQRNYEWVMNGNKPTNIPIDAFNHGMDAIRYYVFTKKKQFVVV
jgi:hypothetical protein